VTSRQVGAEVLAALQKVDEVAYLRFASVYKDFQQITDFERELGLLLEKKEPAKRRSR
jgi:transcriptional repressor NrdR